MLLIGMRWLLDDALQHMIPIDPGQLQTVIFLQLAVGGHLLLFSVRTKGSFFTPPYPSAKLFWALAITQVFAVLICMFGIGVTAIPGSAVVGVWLYCLLWLIAIDVVKLVYRHVVERRAGELQKHEASLAA
jgi:H+-transporting ATPase